MMIKYRVLKKTVCSWGFCIFLVALAYALMAAGPAAAKDGSTPVPKKGLEKGIQQTQEPAAPQPQCPKGMVWSAKDEKCVSKLKPVTQGEGGGGSVSKTPHQEFTLPGGSSNQ
jgi:hypothetical protein